MTWKIKELKKVHLKNPILIEGLPGIGNVGKVAVDFLIEELKAKKIYEMHSYSLPHSVFINDQNLVELPKIEIFHGRFKETDFLLLAGDVQPSDEISCYEFTEEILKLCKINNCKDIITLGGIGLVNIPKKPKIYMTGNTKKAVDKFKEKNVNTKLYGVVGPIVGVSGLLLGLSNNSINAVTILAETYGHPMYLGVKGAKEILKILNNKFEFNIKIEKLDKEIKDMEEEIIKRTEEMTQLTKTDKKSQFTEVNYIG